MFFYLCHDIFIVTFHKLITGNFFKQLYVARNYRVNKFVCHFRNGLPWLALEIMLNKPLAHKFFGKLFLCFAFLLALDIFFFYRNSVMNQGYAPRQSA